MAITFALLTRRGQFASHLCSELGTNIHPSIPKALPNLTISLQITRPIGYLGQMTPMQWLARLTSSGAIALGAFGLAATTSSCGSSGQSAANQAVNVAYWITSYGMADVQKLQSDFQGSANALSAGNSKTAKTECTKLELDTSSMLRQPLPKSNPLAKDWAATVSDSHTFAGECLAAIATGSSNDAAAAQDTGTKVNDDINAVSNDIGELA